MITITVTPETSTQMSIIAKALIALLADTDTPEVAEVVETPKKPRKQKEDPAPVDTPSVPVTATTTPVATAPAEVVAASPSKAITLEEVRAKLAAISQAGKTTEVKALIAATGCTKLTDIPADKYADLMAKAEAL
jgi:hypothetical protein